MYKISGQHFKSTGYVRDCRGGNANSLALILTFRIRHVLPGRSNHGERTQDTPSVIYSREFITLSFLAECYDHGEKIVDTSDVSYYSYLHT